MACVNLVKREGLDFLVLDQTRPDIEVPVARVIVPGLRHFYRRFAPGRLYDVPIKLGMDRPARAGERSQFASSPDLRQPVVRAPRKKGVRRAPPAILSARLNGHVTIEAHAAGDIVARFNGMSLALGQFSSAAAERARELNKGLPLAALASRPQRPSTRKSISWSADWPRAASWNFASCGPVEGADEAIRTW